MEESMKESANLLQNQDANERNSSTFGTRHVLAIMGFLGFANVYAMRVNLSVAIVAMVNSSAIPRHDNGSAEPEDVCPMPEAKPGTSPAKSMVNSSAIPRHDNGSAEPEDVCPMPEAKPGTSPAKDDGHFLWDEYTQGIILSSFFWGYVVSQIPGGVLAERHGAKWLYGFGILITALFTLLTPMAAEAGVFWLILVRVLEGLGEGVTFPAMHVLLAKWAPPGERSSLGSYIYAGSPFGTIIAMALSGPLIRYTGGWPSIFYLFGVLGILWFMALAIK